MRLRLHSYWRSTASYRVRIALNLKGVDYDTRTVDLRTGAQRDPAFLEFNPEGLVPVLEADGRTLTQSLAILEWLDEEAPQPPLLPRDPFARAQVRAVADIICCDIHPLNNLRVQTWLRDVNGAPEGQLTAWTHEWIGRGFAAVEPRLEAGDWCFADAPGLADCCLVPQIYSAVRFGVDLSPFPKIRRVADAAAGHPAFIAAHPDRQPDADRPAP
ncbi:maleylacetoacetate isomerase [Phenylobacterium hankyongense]|uniref:Maleylacetoacetate isomerase n=1 Tax=Phenylobacterium hankyongense TaxID=1813876 RepID=A0A328B007_9CAUL|nr:maleylacetoacetate isomerase [Phenylobacterium hankyongense]RAK60239.1 maleylacetoacetate isomerase [Phenylobacterium hankyongense]